MKNFALDLPALTLTKNTDHYDKKYSTVNVACVVGIVEKFESFLQDAIQTDTSWHGLYHGNFSQQLSGKRVLELGCGNCLNALIMAKLGAEVVANDISSESERIICQAAEHLNLNNIKPMVGDFAKVTVDDRSFDMVVGKAFLHHLPHETETEYFDKIQRILKTDGEARFFEPAVNSLWLDKLRWTIPVPGRPSKLNRRAFETWKETDPHPDRDNSSRHFEALGRKFFRDVSVQPIGSIERLCRLLPNGTWSRRYRRWAHRMELRLPMTFRRFAARSQVINYRNPIAAN